MSKSPPTAKLHRSAISGLALAQAGVRHLGHKAKQLTRDDEAKQSAQNAHEAELGKILFKALNQLKGTALKVSQMLAMEASFLPPAIRQELAKACYQVTPLNRALVHKVFQREFGKTTQEMFAEFDSQAFAAASLGQVHHAKLHDGRQVAVKLQYPGIASSIASDMQMLRTLLQGLASRSSLMPAPSVIEHVMVEAESKLAEEVDYLHEAEQLRWFRSHLNLAGVVIPEPISSHSTNTVLCMSQLGGMHVEQWLATQPSQAQRDHIGQILFDWFVHSSFVLQRVHADPHPGNFLFMADGQLGILDFGCTKILSTEFCQHIAHTWCSMLRREQDVDGDQMRQAYVKLGLIRADLSRADYASHIMPQIVAIQDWQIQPFKCQDADGYFDFAQKSPYPLADREQGEILAKQLAQFDESLLYFDRNYLGIVHMLQRIGARVKTRNPYIC